MNRVIVLIAASFAMGFLTAIPIGATQIEVAKRSMSGHIKGALMLILGAVVSDLLYGFVALYGMLPFLQDRYVEAFFWFISAVILIILGSFTIIYSDKINKSARCPALFGSKTSFLVGFSIDTANPSMIIWWLLCFEFLKNVGIIHMSISSVKTTFIIAGSLGIGTYLALLAIFLKKIGNSIIQKYEGKINRALGVLLIIFSLYFVFKALKMFYNFSI